MIQEVATSIYCGQSPLGLKQVNPGKPGEKPPEAFKLRPLLHRDSEAPYTGTCLPPLPLSLHARVTGTGNFTACGMKGE